MSFLTAFNQSMTQRFIWAKPAAKVLTVAGLTLGGIAIAAPALAHHPLGGEIPSNFFEGFMSGLAHPIIGPDHFACVVALGLLSAQFKKSLLIPVSFVATMIFGAILHLGSFDIPAAESLVALSVIAVGGLLMFTETLMASVMVGFGAIAGILHGYAYGEAIIGAEMSPLSAYFMGLVIIQLMVALTAFGGGKLLQRFFQKPNALILRYIGLFFGTIGIVLLRNTFIGA